VEPRSLKKRIASPGFGASPALEEGAPGAGTGDVACASGKGVLDAAGGA